MKHKVERAIDGSGEWCVLDPDGNVVHQTPVFAWAIDEAVSMYHDSAREFIMVRLQ